MSFKSFSTAQSTSNEDKSGVKGGATAPKDQTPAKAVKTSTDAAPAPKA